MSDRKLSQEDLEETNGGSLLGGNDSSSANSLTNGLNIDELASFSNESSDGDESQKSSGSLGKGIGLGSMGSSSNSND